MPDQHGFGDNGTESTRLRQSGQGDDQMNEYDSEIAHPGNGINTSKTTALRPVCQFAIDSSRVTKDCGMIGKSARSSLDPSAVVCLRNEKGGNNESGEKNKRAAHNKEQRPNERKQCHQKAGENIGFFSSIPMDRVGCGTCSYLRTRWRPNSALLPGGRESVTTVRNGRQAHKAFRSHAQFCSPNTMSEASDRRHPVGCRCPKAPVGGAPEEAEGGVGRSRLFLPRVRVDGVGGAIS